MSRKLHVRAKITFPDPYVLRVVHNNEDPKFIQKVKNHVSKNIRGTWGYSGERIENVKFDTNLYTTAMTSCTYWCFESTQDALQFRLFMGDSSSRVFMWPANIFFTIYEEVDNN